MLDKIWLIPLLPLIGTAINGIFGLLWRRLYGREPDKRFAHTVAVGVVGLAFLLSVWSVYQLFWVEGKQIHKVELFRWMLGGELKLSDGSLTSFSVSWGYQLDPLTAVMILVVTGVGLLIHIYSTGYMWDEGGYYRYFAYLNLFMFAMLTLVMASNFLLMFVGWEGVGLCSYLLIGFWFARKSASDAGKKAFVVNRVGDAGFIIGMMFIFVTFGSLEFTDVFAKAATMAPEVGLGVLTAITLFLFLGACGKSAQIPLYTWLPDAMEGPTPVSALIHAATMVTAGVYMVTRCNALYTRAPFTMEVVAVVGVATALFAATIGLVQRDIKRVLAYSTVSQLGYMFTACGVGAFAAGIFHLYTHAFFKALLFLGSGAVIHALHEQDMFKMGGLKKYLPTTYWTMLVGTLAIAGAPLLSGFFSKDEILWRAWSSGHVGIWAVAWLAAGLTAFYMFRLIFLTFHGQERFDAHHGHIHEAPRSMSVPLVLLAAGSVLAGYIGLPEWLGGSRFERFLEPVFAQAVRLGAHRGEHSTADELKITLASIVIAAVGGFLAYHFYIRRRELPDRLASSLGPGYSLLYNKYYVDEIYDFIFVNGMGKGFGAALWKFDRTVIDGMGVDGSGWLTRAVAYLSSIFDSRVVDGIVNFVGWITDKFSYLFRRVQTGLVQRYALAIIFGILIFVSIYLYAMQ